MESNPLRGLFGVSSPWPVEQRVAPQPTEPIENEILYEYWGGPGLGGLRTTGLYPVAGLLDYEDTRLKTSSRVRMGLYLAWKAS